MLRATPLTVRFSSRLLRSKHLQKVDAGNDVDKPCQLLAAKAKVVPTKHDGQNLSITKENGDPRKATNASSEVKKQGSRQNTSNFQARVFPQAGLHVFK